MAHEFEVLPEQIDTTMNDVEPGIQNIEEGEA